MECWTAVTHTKGSKLKSRVTRMWAVNTRCYKVQSKMIVSLNLSFQRALAEACYCLMCQKIRKLVIWLVLLPWIRWLLLIVVIQKFSSVTVTLYNVLQLLGHYFMEAKNNVICFWCTVLACSRYTQIHAGLNWCLQQKWW